jgi:hypothetical protein
MAIADCNDKDIYSKAENCEVKMEYCFEAHHGDEERDDAAQCLTLEKAQANIDGIEIPDMVEMLCGDTKVRADGTNDCQVCKSRSNPAQYCVTVDANICECVESKSTMDFVAMEEGAECSADGNLNVDICDDCNIDIKVNCMGKAPFGDAWNMPCSSDSGFSIVGENKCEEEIKLCYEIHNTGNTCAYWEDLDVTASRTVTNGDMVSRKDVTVGDDNFMICPGDKVIKCEEPMVINSCNCMTVVAECKAKNPRDGKCSAQANYGFCKEEESRQDETNEPTKSPAKEPVIEPESKKETKSPKSTKAPTTTTSKPTKAPKAPPTRTPTAALESSEIVKSEGKSESKSAPAPTNPPPHPSLPSSGSSRSEDHSGS